MKFMKKAAALIFCLALALSVMAVSASAEGEPTFTVELVNTDTTHHDLNSNSIKDYATNDTVTYNINLKLTGGTETSYKVNAMDFTIAYTDLNNAPTAWLYTGTAVNTSAETAIATATASATYAYVIYDGTQAQYWSIDASGATVGEIRISSGDLKQNTMPTITMSDITVHPVIAGNAVGVSVASPDMTADVEVDTKYTITVVKDNFDSNDVQVHTGEESDKKTTTTYDYYLMSGFAAQGGTAGSSVTIALPGLKNGYNLNTDNTTKSFLNVDSYAVTPASGSHNWETTVSSAVNNTYLQNGLYDTTPKAKYGNVTLTAAYTPIVYTVQYDYDNGTMNTVATDVTSVTYTANDWTTLLTVPKKAGYTFKGWQATSDSEGAWAKDLYYLKDATKDAANQNITALSGSTINTLSGLVWGDVSLKATWAPQDAYTVTYYYNGGTVTTALDGSTAVSQVADGTTVTYTPDNYNTTLYGTPTKDGFTFYGWKATSPSVSTLDNANGYTGFWATDTYYAATAPELPDGITDITTGAITPKTADGTTVTADDTSVYGNVTLTAMWVPTGYFKQFTYKFGYNQDKLTLFAVETSKVGGVYEYGTDTDTKTMYKVSSKYAPLFGKDSSGNPKVTSNYTIFATIAPAVSGNAGMLAISYTPGGNRNGDITYDGHIVTTNGRVNSGDYGAAGAVYDKPDTYTNAVLSVAARLKADMAETNAIESAETEGNLIGTINDIKAIMNLVASNGG